VVKGEMALEDVVDEIADQEFGILNSLVGYWVGGGKFSRVGVFGDGNG
jgi:hypothetical protein